MGDENLDALAAHLTAQIEQSVDLQALEDIRVGALGKKGRISALLKTLGTMPPEERQEKGAQINGLKTRITAAIAARKAVLEDAALTAKLAADMQDISLPVLQASTMQGRVHPVSQVMDELTEIFAAMEFTLSEGPDIESDYYNFTALNIPETHPARQMHDTFYLDQAEDDGATVLRTHTSPVQIRTMQAGTPPFRFVALGRTYRCDSDQTHTPMFHQIEGLVVDKHTHLGHLKWTLQTCLSAFFEVDNVALRFRPSYFPFTEPSMEVDMQCVHEDGVLKVGEGTGWMEIGGSGMVHPRVLREVGLDPEIYQGFAFGMGVDRLAMLKYGIPDLRGFFDADIRWLRHYGFLPLDIPHLARGLAEG